jgi:hypothetical protein
MISGNAKGFTKFAKIISGGDRASRFEVLITKSVEAKEDAGGLPGGGLLDNIMDTLSKSKANLDNYSLIAKAISMPAMETQVKEYYFRGRKVPLPAVNDYVHEIDITFYNDNMLDLRKLFENLFTEQTESTKEYVSFNITINSLTADYVDSLLGGLKQLGESFANSFDFFGDDMHKLDLGYNINLFNCYIKGISQIDKNIESINTMTETTVSFIFSSAMAFPSDNGHLSTK